MATSSLFSSLCLFLEAHIHPSHRLGPQMTTLRRDSGQRQHTTRRGTKASADRLVGEPAEERDEDEVSKCEEEHMLNAASDLGG